MLERGNEAKNITQSPEVEKNVYRKTLNDFLESVPVEGKLFQGSEFSESFRAVAFGQIFERLKIILRGYGLLSKADQEEVMARVNTVKAEAHRWSHRSSKRDFEKELEDMVFSRATSTGHIKPRFTIVRSKN